MKVIITGGGGFLGHRLAQSILERGSLTAPSGQIETIDDLVLFDCAHHRPALPAPARTVTGDISDPDHIGALFDRDDISLFHLASIVSGDGERDFDAALKVNLDGTRLLFEACRALSSLPRVVFASSLAVFGGSNMPPTVGDSTRRHPETTYGMTKLIGELLIQDYSRKGFFDGRAARLPTIIIRPGAPNAAASSFASGMFREPLAGKPCHLPVPRDQAVPVLGYPTAIKCFIALHELPPESLGDDRTLTLPSKRHTVAHMIETMQKVASQHGITPSEIIDAPDPIIQKIVTSWPIETDAKRALDLGLPDESPLEEIIESYLSDYSPPFPA